MVQSVRTAERHTIFDAAVTFVLAKEAGTNGRLELLIRYDGFTIHSYRFYALRIERSQSAPIESIRRSVPDA